VVEAISPDGVPVLAAFSRLSDTGWGVSVAIPTAQLTGRASRNAITAATVGLILFALGFWFAYGFSRSVIGPISALRRFAVNSHDAGAEPGTAVVKTGLAEVDEVADVLRAGVRRARATQLSLDVALEKSADAQAQRDLLLREVYHRVKNNLQIVDALLSMQERQLSGNEAKLTLTPLRGRIQVLGLVHEQLMKSGDLVTFDVAPFLDELCRNIVASGADRTITLSVDVMPLMVTLDFAVPLGLVVTELVTNCLKHAFRQDNGRVSVILHRNSKSDVVLIVSDNGGASVCPGAQQERLGMKIIRGLVGQLDGVMKVGHDDGRRTEILLAS
jgi:two-component sensor histidine kinase